jgi:tetratricopeptide (TPR) repeat protein
MVALLEILEADPDSNPHDLEGLARNVEQARKKLQEIIDAVVGRAGPERDPRKLVQGYVQQQCLLRALTELEEGRETLKGDLPFERLRIELLLETGRIEEAYEAAGSFASQAEQARLPDWADLVAKVNLVFGDWPGAVERWQKAADDAESQSLNAVLLSLAPHRNNAPWPITTTYSMLDFLYERPESIANLRMNVALARLEEGQVEQARTLFHDVLATNPDTLNRPLVAFYLRLLSEGKELIDLWSPSDRVFEMFEPEPEAE